MDYSTALQSFLALKTVITDALGSKVDSAVKEAVTDLSAKLIQAQESAVGTQMALSDLQAKTRHLESEVARLLKWSDEKQRYKLFQPPGFYAPVYGIRASQGHSEAPHYLCPTCYQQARHSFLSAKPNRDRWTLLACTCGYEVATTHGGPMVPSYAPD